MIFHLQSVGKHLWLLAVPGTVVLAEGRSQQVASSALQPSTPVQASARSRQGGQHDPAVKTPPAGAWSALWRYRRLVVEDCQGSIFSTLRCALHRQRRIVADVPNLSKLSFQHRVKLQELSVRRRQLQPCKFQLKISLQHNNDIHCTGNMYGAS